MNLKKVRTIAVLLIVVLVSVVAFGGLYVKKQGTWQNLLPDFNYGMELNGIRELRFSLDQTEEEKEVYVDENGNIMGEVTEEHDHEEETAENTEGQSEQSTENTEANSETQAEQSAENQDTQNVEETVNGYKTETRVIKANKDEDVNIDNFEKSKKVIQKRLEALSSYEYNIRIDTITGELVVEVPDDDNLELEKSLISTIGKIQIVDHDTGLILIDNNCVKRAQTVNSQSESGYQFYLQLQLDKEGTEKLKSISKEYISTVDGAGTETIKYISVNLDGQELLTTYFGEEVTNGMIQIPMGDVVTESEAFNDTRDRVQRIAEVVNGDAMPLAYVLSSDNYVKSVITDDMIFVAEIVFAIVVALVSIFFIIKYKLKGLSLSIISIGYIALLTLVMRYTNVNITLNGLISFIAVIAINYVFDIKMLNGLKNISNTKAVFGKSMKELYLTIIPVCIIAIIFTFMSGVIISSIGMVLFWGLLLQAVYNTLVIFALDVI